MPTITVSEAHQQIGQQVTLQGWLYNKRSSGKILFLQIRDGSGVIQAVLGVSDNPDLFEKASQLSRETSLIVHGSVKEDHRSSIGCELLLEDLEVIHQPNEDFPIELKEQTPGFLMDHRHLWIRTGRQVPVLRIRDAAFRAFREFFHQRGFVATEAPILTGTSVEGTTTLFELDYFGDPAYLGQSGQLYLEATAMALGRVYWIGPAFRAEKSKTRKHVTEFWIAEAEMAFYDHKANLDLQEELVRYIVTTVIDERAAELKDLDRDVDLLRSEVSEPFARIDYGEAVTLLQELGHDVSFGDDFGAPQEAALGDHFKRPVFIERFPTEMKPFYMKRDPSDPSRVMAADLIAPEGYGEITGGSQRVDSEADLIAQLQEAGLAVEPYQWYVDLRKYGSVPHSGFGMGLARVISWITGVSHIRETIPFPRQINRLYP
jgi:asparaginyl-tRNA synthetase